jgi:tetratricopeptide (TPR) repeat protein
MKPDKILYIQKIIDHVDYMGGVDSDIDKPANQIKCSICLGEIRDEEFLFECECKKTYHSECAEKVGNCVSCKKQYSGENFKEYREFFSFFKSGKKAFANKQYEDALSSFDSALKIRGNSFLTWNLKGMVNTELRRYDRALDCYEMAVKEGKRGEPYYNMACTLIRMKRMDEAQDCITLAHALNPLDLDTIYVKGYINLKVGDSQAALDCFNEVLKKDPNYIGAKKGKEKILGRR